jgi:hypothetical protein
MAENDRLDDALAMMETAQSMARMYPSKPNAYVPLLVGAIGAHLEWVRSTWPKQPSSISEAAEGRVSPTTVIRDIEECLQVFVGPAGLYRSVEVSTIFPPTPTATRTMHVNVVDQGRPKVYRVTVEQVE